MQRAGPNYRTRSSSKAPPRTADKQNKGSQKCRWKRLLMESASFDPEPQVTDVFTVTEGNGTEILSFQCLWVQTKSEWEHLLSTMCSHFWTIQKIKFWSWDSSRSGSKYFAWRKCGDCWEQPGTPPHNVQAGIGGAPHPPSRLYSPGWILKFFWRSYWCLEFTLVLCSNITPGGIWVYGYKDWTCVEDNYPTCFMITPGL